MTGEFAIAVHALVFLNHKATYISSEQLANNVCTNPARIRKIMAKLKKRGLVTTKEGVDGGYLFEKDPKTVTLRQVCEAVETCVVSASWRPGDVDRECLISSGMGATMDEIYKQLDDFCKEKLEQITIAQIHAQIFGT